MTPSPPDPSLPSRLREFHERLPLAGAPRNVVLSLPDDRLLDLVALLRDTPQPTPAMSPEEWRAFHYVRLQRATYLHDKIQKGGAIRGSS